MPDEVASNTAGKGTVLYDRNAVYDALDILPPAIRRFFREAPQNWSPVETAREYRKAIATGVPEAVIVQRFVRFSEGIVAEEIMTFAKEHVLQHGYALPHVAAMASIQPYGDREPFATTSRRATKNLWARMRNPI